MDEWDIRKYYDCDKCDLGKHLRIESHPWSQRLGTIQIIRDTFLAYFRSPSPMCHLLTLARPSPPPCDVTIFFSQKT